MWGAASGFGALVNNNCKSFVMYRTHLIDIDASGMALADIVAAEQQLFNANFNAGGKYAGDTIPTSHRSCLNIYLWLNSKVTPG
ncbi:Uncharacterised protein [Klebsiella variicola]|nr:Uncharacterised protein [Klebsiella variicola]